MNRYRIFLLFIIFCSRLTAQTLQIEGLGGNGNLILTTNYWQAGTIQKVFQLSVNQGTANTLLNLDKPTLAFAEYGDYRFPVFLAPGQNARLSFNGRQYAATNAENDLLGKLYATVGSFKKLPFNNSMVNYYVLEGMLNRPVNSGLLETVINQSSASYAFKNKIRSWMQYESAAAQGHRSSKMPVYNAFNPEVPGSANYAFLLALNLSSASALADYRGYYAVFKAFSDKTSGKLLAFGQKELIKNIYTSTQDDAFLKQAFERFNQTNTHSKYEEELVDLYGSRLGRSAQISVPDITFLKDDGHAGRLFNFQGRVVYLSFWASWCKPCIAGFEKTAATRKELEKMGVVLLNVSIDKTQDAWRKALNTHNPLGVNVWATNLSQLAQDYQITSIPLYHIIDKQGNFAYLSDEKGRDIYAEFQKLVNQN